MDNVSFQETCVYPRLNAALRNHDMRNLTSFLPYMKLLLSALYQLPLTHASTYRGVELELFQVTPPLTTYNDEQDSSVQCCSFVSNASNVRISQIDRR